MTGKFLRSINWHKIQEPWMSYDNYPCYNDKNGLGKCPWCGKDFYIQTDPVMGLDGELIDDYYTTNADDRVYHQDCWETRKNLKRELENESIATYTD